MRAFTGKYQSIVKDSDKTRYVNILFQLYICFFI